MKQNKPNYTKIAESLGTSLKRLKERSRTKHICLLRSAFCYIAYVHLLQNGLRKTEAYRAIGKALHRSTNNVCEQVAIFELDFSDHCHRLGISEEILPPPISIGRKVRLQPVDWYKHNGRFSHSIVCYDGSIIYSTTRTQEVCDKMRFAGAVVTPAQVVYIKGVPSYFHIAEDEGRHRYAFNEVSESYPPTIDSLR